MTDFKQFGGKSDMLKKHIKKLNKARRKQGLKKLKVVEIQLKVPKHWDVTYVSGYPFK
jgi:hypothetical protein